MTNLQRAHLVVALGVLNLCLAGMGLAVSNVSRAGASANSQPNANDQAKAAPVESLSTPAGTDRPGSARPPSVGLEATPGSSPASSVEPSPTAGQVAQLPSPPPSPRAPQPEVLGKRSLSSNGSGLVTVSPGRPVATVTVTIRANNSVSAGRGERSLSVHLRGALRRAARAGDLPTPVVAAITRLDSTARAMSWSSGPELDDRVGSGCPASGECVQSYRIVVALVDPAVRTATFAWTAEARAVLDRGTFPTDARLTVKATHRASIRRAATALDGLAVQRAQLDAAHPRLVREVTIDLPAGLDREELAGVLLRASVKAKTATQPGNVEIAVFLDGRRLSGSRPGDRAPRLAFDPFVNCRTAKPCRLNLRVELRRLGADTGPRVTVAWAVSAWAADPRPLARPSGLTVELGGQPELPPKPERSKEPGPTGSKGG